MKSPNIDSETWRISTKNRQKHKKSENENRNIDQQKFAILCK